MSNIRTKTLIKSETLTILSSVDNEEPKVFTNSKTLYLNIDSSKALHGGINAPIEDGFFAAIEEWIGRVEKDRDKYKLEKLEPNISQYGGVAIKYNETVLIKLYLYPAVVRKTNNGSLASAVFVCGYIKKSDEIQGIERSKTFYIDDRNFFTTQNVKDEKMSLIDLLDYFIPIRSEAIIEGISYVFKVNPRDIILDTYRKKYIIKTPYLFEEIEKPKHPKTFYKYVSLSTYHSMLQHKTFRMNSIICQSDETESLYIGDFLCEEHDTEESKGGDIIKESNVFISSFTAVANNPKMWEEYGNNGKGVMLGFESIGGDILSYIQYINEKSTKLNSLKEDVKAFKENDIHVYFSDIDARHRFIKSNKYQYEKEWRLIKEYEGKLNSTIYYDPNTGTETYAKYHDFPFQGDLIPELKMRLVSVTFGQNQRPSNIPLLTKDTLECFGNDVIISHYKDQDIKEV